MVFVGFSTSEAFGLGFRILIASLAAIGVILTPIYLLSMLREIFFGQENVDLVSHSKLVDAEPREIYVISCLLVPIFGIGLYPRLMTDSYKASIDSLVRQELLALSKVGTPATPRFFQAINPPAGMAAFAWKAPPLTSLPVPS
jgi:NAD(P)H-quinone oxidoreductase subunit 4